MKKETKGSPSNLSASGIAGRYSTFRVGEVPPYLILMKTAVSRI
jgi:hypothetical protein